MIRLEVAAPVEPVVVELSATSNRAVGLARCRVLAVQFLLDSVEHRIGGFVAAAASTETAGVVVGCGLFD